MRFARPLAASLVGLSLLGTIAAEEVEEEPIPCETDVDVIDEGDSASYDGMAPVVFFPGGGDVPVEDPTGLSAGEIATVAGSVGETAIKATITATMTWDVPGDYELMVYDADGTNIGSSTAFNPTDGNVESTTVTVDPCEAVTFVVENYAGTPGGPVALEVSVDGKRPRVRG